MNAVRGYTGSLDEVYRLDPHLFIVSLQYRKVVPKLPDENAVCVIGDCYNLASDYIVFEGEFQAFDGETKFGIAPVCDDCNIDEIDMENVRLWTKHNVTLKPK